MVCSTLEVEIYTLALYWSCRKVKEAWESKKDVLVKSGTSAIEQLSEALSVSALSDKLSEGLAQSALLKCTKTVNN